MTFLGGDTHIEAGQEDPNYHITQARIAIGSGGLTGLGIGNSVQASGYLPEATTDLMFAVMGEMSGFVGLVAILGLFTGLLFALLGVAARLPDMKLRLVVAGVFGWVARDFECGGDDGRCTSDGNSAAVAEPGRVKYYVYWCAGIGISAVEIYDT